MMLFVIVVIVIVIGIPVLVVKSSSILAIHYYLSTHPIALLRIDVCFTTTTNMKDGRTNSFSSNSMLEEEVRVRYP
jgi:hypothetical protein